MLEFKTFLWSLKFGALLNFYFLYKTSHLYGQMDNQLIIPAMILFAVSAYRCIFPNKYEHNVVFHDTIFSSIFLTRFLATFSEITYIFLFSLVIRILNINRIFWIDLLSWIMVFQVTLSQFCVWGAIITGLLKLYFYEELGWAVIFLANTITSAYLYLNGFYLDENKILLNLNLIFGAFYLPWQIMHLYSLLVQAKSDKINSTDKTLDKSTYSVVSNGLIRAIFYRDRKIDSKSWGGFIGLTWMLAYFATLIPMWVFYILHILNESK